MNLLVKLVGPVALPVLLAACASPSPAPVLLTLPPVATAPSAMPPEASASSPVLAVRRVGIPEYLVARRVRYRADAATLAEWPNTYWAERIEVGVSREFVSALRQQLPGWSICDTNCGDLAPTLTVQLTLAPMDYLRTAQKLQARARIAISGAGPLARLPETREMAIDIPAGADSAQAQAQAITALIGKVAIEAAPMIRNARP